MVGDNRKCSNFGTLKGLEWAFNDAESRKGKSGFKGAIANLSLGLGKSEAFILAVYVVAQRLIVTIAVGNGI